MSRYVSHDFRTEISFLGLESSPAFVREPEGNGCAERFIRTLKENLLRVRSFETIEDLRLALATWIERTYHRRRRRQRRLGKLAPVEYETIMKPAVDLAA